VFADWEEDDENAADEKSTTASADAAGRTPAAAVPSGQDAANVFVQVNFLPLVLTCRSSCCWLVLSPRKFTLNNRNMT